MKTLALLFVAIGAPFCVQAQTGPLHARFELRGMASYNYSFASSATEHNWFDIPGAYKKEQTVTFAPGAGYFISDEFELLFDLWYSLSYSENNLFNFFLERPELTTWNHRIGSALGISYNLPVSRYFVPYVGAKVGLRWSRILDKGPDDTGWSQREFVLPDLVLGGRFFVTDNWAVTMQVEYAKTSPYDFESHYGDYWDSNESVSFGIGFSVFL